MSRKHTVKTTPTSKFRLDGRRAMVTGGSKGIGEALARGLAEAGADLILVARGQDALNSAQTRLGNTGRQIETAPFDLVDTDAIADFYGRVTDQYGPIDILVNNAGTTRRGAIDKLTLEDWRVVIELNLTSMFALSQVFARERISADQPGKIINIGSLMSSTARANNVPYASSKGGVLLMTKALAVDLAPHNILVNAIGPGFIDTPMNKPLVEDPQFSQWVEERCPLGRWGTPEDIAGTVVFLASSASDFLTGQMIYVDGGWLARF